MEITMAGSYGNRIARSRSIEEMATVLREIVKNDLSIKYEYTFQELAEKLKQKNIDPEIKSRLAVLCGSLAGVGDLKKTPPPKKYSTH